MKPFEPNIIYQDNHLLIVNKPCGLLTQPTELENESLEILLKEWIKENYKKPGNVFLGVIHRLDRPVSGIIIFAKTSKALTRLNESLRNHKIKKTYMAKVEGMPPSEKGTLEHYLLHDKHKAYLTKNDRPGVKPARLHYQIYKSFPKTCLLEINLETGRYHQIRAQLSAIGCPILGDHKYGSSHPFPNGIALHHFRCQIIHPVSEETLCFEIPLPDDFFI